MLHLCSSTHGIALRECGHNHRRKMGITYINAPLFHHNANCRDQSIVQRLLEGIHRGQCHSSCSAGRKSTINDFLQVLVFLGVIVEQHLHATKGQLQTTRLPWEIGESRQCAESTCICKRFAHFLSPPPYGNCSIHCTYTEVLCGIYHVSHEYSATKYTNI